MESWENEGGRLSKPILESGDEVWIKAKVYQANDDEQVALIEITGFQNGPTGYFSATFPYSYIRKEPHG